MVLPSYNILSYLIKRYFKLIILFPTLNLNNSRQLLLLLAFFSLKFIWIKSYFIEILLIIKLFLIHKNINSIENNSII